MSTVTRNVKRIIISSNNVKFRERIMTQLGKDLPFNIKVDETNNNIIIRRASTINFEEVQKNIIQIATRCLEPLSIVDKIQNTETKVYPYKSWFGWFGEKVASTTTVTIPPDNTEDDD